MKRFTGWILTFLGGSATIWGAVAIVTSSTQKRLSITDDFEPTALAVGLVGVAVLTIGLIWVRD